MAYWFKYFRVWAIIKRKSAYRLLFNTNLDYTKFAIVCTSRSGSTWLHTLLNSHPFIISKGEIVLRKHKLNQDFSMGKDVYHLHASPIEAVGLKVFYGLENDIYNGALQELKADTTIKVIHLARKDRLAQFVSLQHAKRSKEWSYQTSEETRPLRIDLAAFQQFEEQQSKLQAEIDQEFSGRILNISYEDLISWQSETLESVQQFLGVKKKKLFSALKKQSTLPLSEQVENWSDFENIVYK